ncbi:MAG: hypothetical protein A2689_02050 [Candidatus Levybacteria bacterium RIFCSPHIGHO2_01_FULL_38_96]|nr:MAG: hypothetical protein A2689_02050 [Candidatus Levybacteria bacterium RIFCSPHIGHO2_01_FULL_38_96]
MVDPSYAILIFPPLQLPYGTYFIHYHGGDGSEWVSNSFEYIPNEAPTADAGAPQTVFEGDSIQFDASGSSDPDGASDITSYSWEFGDGETGTGINPTHVYKDNGTYTATLTVEDTYGEKDIDNVVISVNNAAPVVGAISASQAYFILGNPTTINTAGSFTDAGILDIHSALWDFGEGISLGNVTESNGNGTATGTFVYTVPGTYTVSLTVTDNDGDSGISQNSLTVSVVTSEGAVNDLLDVIEGFNLHNGIQNSLDGKLEAAQNALDDLNVNNDQAAINSLNAFINTVEQKRGDELTDAEADYLIAAAQAIIDSITS